MLKPYKELPRERKIELLAHWHNGGEMWYSDKGIADWTKDVSTALSPSVPDLIFLTGDEYRAMLDEKRAESQERIDSLLSTL